MKVCYFLYAEARTLSSVVNTWNVLNHTDVDIYVHTQTTSIQKNETLSIDESFIVDESFIKKYLPSSTVFLEDRDDFNSNKYGDIHTNFYAYRLLFEKLTQIDIDYDFIIVNRLDSILYIHDIEYFFQNYEHDTIYLKDTIRKDIDSSKLFVEDHFFMGSYNSVMHLLDKLPPPDKLEYSHQGFAEYLNNIDLNISNYDDKIFNIHLRPNMRYLFDSYFKNNHILNKDISFFKFFSEFMSKHSQLENNWKNIK